MNREFLADGSENATDVVVVGGGLGGLATAAFLARAGKQVVLYEKRDQLGGRARTQILDGFRFNLGPHALYRKGLGIAVLKELGIEMDGGRPGQMGGFAIRSKVFHTLPMGFVSLLSSGLLRAGEKLETARFLIRLRSLDPAPLQRISVDDWLRQNITSNSVRELIAAVVRLTTYTNDPERLSAGAALQQVQQSFAGVLYLHDGWQTLVDRLRKLNEGLGVRIFTGCTVKSIVREGKVRGARLSDGRVRSSPIVVIADSPSTAMGLLKESRSSVTNWEDSSIPVHISCFDVALTSLPRPKALLALGIDQPIYASVHSSVARLAPNDGALIHVARYGKPGDPPAEDTEGELVAVLDGLQPGWRRQVVFRRFLPQLTVSHALVSIANGGLRGRQGPAVLDIPGLYVVGDWVGPEGMLADATLASARRAATAILSLPHPQRNENNGSTHEPFGARSL